LHETSQLITVQRMDRAEFHAAVREAWKASGVCALGSLSSRHRSDGY
jgi:hypothetical protein